MTWSGAPAHTHPRARTWALAQIPPWAYAHALAHAPPRTQAPTPADQLQIKRQRSGRIGKHKI